MKRGLEELAWYGGPSPYDDPPTPPPPPAPPDWAHLRGEHAPEGPKNVDDAKHIGVVIGRFSPPHFGHVHVVSAAFKRCGLLYVLSPKSGSDEARSLHARAVLGAFAEYSSHVVCFDAGDVPKDPRAPGFASTWAAYVKKNAPNATRIFSSDAVGGPLLAKELGIEHILVDVDRVTFPIASTQIREDVFGRFHWVAVGARPALAFHVMLLGPECAGKTTLARELSAALDAPLVEDQLRLEATRAQAIPSADAFTKTITDAFSLRDQAAKDAKGGIVISDNSARLAWLWARRLDVQIGAHVSYHHVTTWEAGTLSLLCHDDFGFVGPADRDDPVARKKMLDDIRTMHTQTNQLANLVEISGTDGPARVETALHAIAVRLAARKKQLADLLD